MKSYVKDNETKTDSLLEHERLHLRIGNYLAQQATAKLKPFVTEWKPAKAVGNSKVDAEGNARSKVRSALEDAKKAYLNTWDKILAAVTANYDHVAQTNHGQNAVKQAEWAANWQQRVDDEIRYQGQ